MEGALVTIVTPFSSRKRRSSGSWTWAGGRGTWKRRETWTVPWGVGKRSGALRSPVMRVSSRVTSATFPWRTSSRNSV